MNTYKLIRSARKTMSMSIDKDLQVVVRAPVFMLKPDIDVFVNKHLNWIEKHRKIIQERIENKTANTLTDEQIRELKRNAKAILPLRVEYYRKIMAVSHNGIKITSAATRWGSCSARNNLCFSYRTMLLPPDLIDYIVVHELAHIRVKNHSAKFYGEVSKYMPDYKQRNSSIKRISRQLPI